MKIRAILMDMDGTVLGNSQVAISERNMRAIYKAMEKGVHVIPCTGRTFNCMPPQLLTLPGLRYFITSHGARAYDRETGETIYEDLIPCEEAVELLEILEGHGLFNEIAADKIVHMEKEMVDPIDWSLVPEHHLWYMRDGRYVTVEKPSEYFRKKGLGVEKMNIYNIPEKYQQEMYDRVTATGYIYHPKPGAALHMEFLHKGLDKLCAVKEVLDRLGVSFEETLAIGDSVSDLAIIKACGVGVAMGNAPADIQAAADFVTAPNYEDGVGVAFEKFLEL